MKMLALNPILIGRLILIGGVAWAIWWVYDTYQDGEDAKIALAASEQALAESKETLAQHVRNQELENWVRTQYIGKLEAAQNENARVEKCISDGTCVRTIRVLVPTNVPAGIAAGNSAGTQEITAQLSSKDARTITDIEHLAEHWQAWGESCQQTLMNWQTKKPAN